MPDTPLNPDALEAVAHERYEARRSFEGLPPWEDLLERNRKAEIRGLGNIVSAYLAAAQPEVNSVEELDALPDGTIVKDSEAEVYIMTPYDEFWRVWGNDKRFSSSEIVLPARVLYRPTKESE